MVAPALVAARVVPRRSKHHAMTRRPVTDSQVGGWRQRLGPWEVSLCEAVLGGRLRSHGYQLSGAAAPPLAVRLRYERVWFRHRFAEPRRLALRAAQLLRREPPLADPATR
jgi:hypothetical protein